MTWDSIHQIYWSNIIAVFKLLKQRNNAQHFCSCELPRGEKVQRPNYIYNNINSNKQTDYTYHGENVLELKTGKDKYLFINELDKLQKSSSKKFGFYCKTKN